MSTQTLPARPAIHQQEQQRVAPSEDSRSRKSDSAFRTISEVADDLGVQQHVLRFWETKFSQVRPLKRGGGRRYYRPEDVTLLKKIHELLYTEGYTIKGVQKLLREVGKSQLLQDAPAPKAARPLTAEPARRAQQSAAGFGPRQQNMLESVLVELQELRRMVGKG